MLRVESLHVHYGSHHVLRGVSLEVARAETVAVLGRNGAGKTTLLRGILGLTPITSGRVQLDGVDIAGEPPEVIARLGIAYVPKEHQVFPRLTVMENLKIAAAQANTPKKSVWEMLERFPEFKPRMDQPAGTLSGGEQQLLAIMRALLTQPRLVLMDEPAEGMMPTLVEKIASTIRTLNAGGTSVLLVEHRVPIALEVSSRILVMEAGRIVHETSGGINHARKEALLRSLGVQP